MCAVTQLGGNVLCAVTKSRVHANKNFALQCCMCCVVVCVGHFTELCNVTPKVAIHHANIFVFKKLQAKQRKSFVEFDPIRRQAIRETNNLPDQTTDNTRPDCIGGACARPRTKRFYNILRCNCVLPATKNRYPPPENRSLKN